nr:transferrin-binding protein-like solute binding protein [uncultured Sphingomonas sp.]
MRMDVVRRLPFVALVIAVSACGGGGGGGVGSTPAPPTTPTPPTTPPPPPPPTGTNSTLVAPLLSETFANRNSEIVLTADVNAGTGTSTVGQKTLGLSYDATTNSYTLTANGRTLVFGPGDIDAAKSTSTLTVYVKGTSNTDSDTLTLTKAGTSGRFTYRYVGGAFWERSQLIGNALTASAQSSVYGVVTPSAGVPRTGTASYAVDLIGYVTMQANPLGITGSGRLDVDFEKGQLIANGVIPQAPNTAFSGTFRSAATLSSNANSFSGSFGIDAFGSYSGTVDGMFFGPNAEEVGAAWTARQDGTSAAAGVLIGRREGTIGNTSFDAVTNNALYYPTSSRLDYRQTATTPQNATVADSPLTIHYNVSTGTYTLIAPDRSVVFRGLGPNAVGGEVMPVSGTTDDRLTVSGAGSYVRAGAWRSSANSAQGNALDIRLQHFILGMPTASAAVPRTGEAAYAIQVAGSAADADYPNRMDFGGTGLMRIDFGAGTLNLTSGLNYREDWFLSGRPAFTANGQLNGTGALSSSANAFNGSLSLSGIGDYSGSFAGQLFGPSGQEMGATFKATDGAGGAASGTILGKRDDSILAGDKGLLQLTQPTSFAASDIDVTFDPAAGTWRLNNTAYARSMPGFDITVGPGDRVATLSSATRTYYDRTAGDTRLAGYFFNPGSGNPQLALTYTSFGAFDVTSTHPNYAGTYGISFHFGIPTNVATLPKSGIATYNGLVLGGGRYEPISFTTAITGTSAFRVDFGAMTWSGSLALSGAPAGSGTAATFLGTFNYGGEVASNGFFGNGMPNGANYYGSLMSRFYGPAAAEIGGNWSLVGSDAAGYRFELQGITVGRKN